MAQRERS